MQADTAFVPTMGALHAGHLELIKSARKLSSEVVVSIFVNPLQFENSDDLAKYPRDLEGDSEKALAAGATRIWAPSYDEVYPGEIQKISAGPIGDLFEGRHRIGHFDGMLTVVNRLFEVVKPKYAIFGEKDFQQLFIVKKWVAEREIPVEIISAPTVRDGDGLALSSRNVRLSPEDRQRALVINRALAAGNKEGMLKVLKTEPHFEVDYAEVIDAMSFDIAGPETQLKRGIVAGWINGIRLIDNMAMGSNA